MVKVPNSGAAIPCRDICMNAEAALHEQPKLLPLDAWHRAQGARMVQFAGYSMPLQYVGIVAEHEWTRSHASLFDVSHMGQLVVAGERAPEQLERLLPTDVAGLAPGRVRYSLLLDQDGGILDDLMITRMSGEFSKGFALVVNGATKIDDIAFLSEHLPDDLIFLHLETQALVALQGPLAAQPLDKLVPGIAAELGFMQAAQRCWQGNRLNISRTGYTGEDGFEISLPAEAVVSFSNALLADGQVKPAGLGARHSLRLEAGLPLYGHDLDRTTDPISADLTFALSKSRRALGGYSGHERISRILAEGPAHKRIGLALDGRQPAREGAPVFAGEFEVGRVTSGCFSPTLGHPIAMAYVAAAHTAPGTELSIEVRGKSLPAQVVPLPFVPHRYHRIGAPK